MFIERSEVLEIVILYNSRHMITFVKHILSRVNVIWLRNRKYGICWHQGDHCGFVYCRHLILVMLFHISDGGIEFHMLENI